MNVKIAEPWRELLQPEFEKPYFAALADFVRAQYASPTPIYPPARDIFRAFEACLPQHLKVVIIGQDPYHGAGQANGLCFSVAEGVRFPPSLYNIFKEIQAETGDKIPASGDLRRWAGQGVLLLNSVLTVRAEQAASHAGQGWETFTDAVVATINARFSNIVYLLWGAYAQRKGAVIDAHRNLVLKSAHPSPLSAHNGFFGNGHFTKVNEYLEAHQKTPIEW